MDERATPSHADAVEALLFAAGEPLSYARLCTLLSTDMAGLTKACSELESRLRHGIRLVRTETTAGLATSPECEAAVTALIGDPGERDIGQAGLEVLAILLYEGPATKAAIDHVRGVNSSSTLRTLMYRGLIERVRADGSREATYHPTADVLAHLSITDPSSLPGREEIRSELARFLSHSREATPTAE